MKWKQYFSIRKHGFYVRFFQLRRLQLLITGVSHRVSVNNDIDIYLQERKAIFPQQNAFGA